MVLFRAALMDVPPVTDVLRESDVAAMVLPLATRRTDASAGGH